MEGFKTNPKMVKNLPCYKEGGAVYKSRHSEKKEMGEDVAQDKKIVKKAFSMHDKQEHKGEHTDLSKLKKGGRAKKDCGTVRKYKTGGMVENQYAAKKTNKDMKDIANAKRQKPEMLANGKSVKKMQAGGLSGALLGGGVGGGMPVSPMNPRMDARALMEEKLKRRDMEKMARAQKYLSPEQQGELISQSPEAAGLPPAPPMKKGGKVNKMNTGGMSGPVSPVAQEIIEGKRPPQETPGQMTPEERRASVAKAFGAKTKKMRTGGTCS